MPKTSTARTAKTPEHQSGPRSISGGFKPAERTIPSRPTAAPHEAEDEAEDEVGGDPDGEHHTTKMGEPDRRFKGQRDVIQREHPTTKNGYPDRRFKGQRDLPAPPEQDIPKTRTGGTVGDIHITINKKPDRRYKENRSMSDEEVNRKWLEAMNKEYGSKQ